MIFQDRHELEIQGTSYVILGSIAYEDKTQNDHWEEYRLLRLKDHSEHWLSVDHGNAEYEMSFIAGKMLVPDGFKLVDKGTETVKACSGNVDVEVGEFAHYETYEDESGDHTFSIEEWGDETEYSRGMYIEFGDIRDLGATDAAKKELAARQNSKVLRGAACIVLCIVLAVLTMPRRSNRTTSIIVDDQLAVMSQYTHEARVEDDGCTANVYSTSMSVSDTAREIISLLEGNVENVQEDADGRTVAILTPYEYILVYEDAGEDGMGLGDTDDAKSTSQELGTSGEDAGWEDLQSDEDDDSAQSDSARTLVQVSNRKYAFSTDRRPYHARYRSYHWYRRFYRAEGYASDLASNSDTTSSYGRYTGETTVDSPSGNTYESYAESIRQQSVGSSSSTGGGTSFGK